jgi:Domain of unknown function (DUF5664)
MSGKFELKSSGTEQKFSTGAVRDISDSKPLLSLVSPFAVRRLGDWLTRGAKRYSPRNWEKGFPFSRCIDSLERHVQAFKAGDTDEDHLAACMCNVMFLIHYQDMIKRGVLPAELNDMPDYGSPEQEPEPAKLSRKPKPKPVKQKSNAKRRRHG